MASADATFDRLERTEFVYNRFNSLTIRAQREKLPIFQFRNHILYLLERFQCVLVVGETGSGKSTQIPQYLVESEWPGRILVTQPRKVAAVSLAKRVAQELGTVTANEDSDSSGLLVAHSVKWDVCRQPVKIKYVTEGMLMREMMADPLLQSYTAVMLDEVHERSLNIDIIMGLLKKVLKKRKNLKLIISSATLNAESLRDFFNLNRTSRDAGKDTAAIVSVEGRQYPVEIFYAKEPVADYVRATVETVIKIHESADRGGDVLAFLTGQDEVDDAVSSLRNFQNENNAKNRNKLLVLPMYGSLRYNDQLEVFKYAPHNHRKIVVATNIAESSITIPNIVYVIDCGFVKAKWFLRDACTDHLTVVPISKASANQRSGRAGRTRSGKAYRLYTEADAQRLQTSAPPEMLRADLSGAVLYLKAMGVANIARFDFPTAPPAHNLLAALESLVALGALNRTDGSLTRPLGETMAEFALEPVLSKLLLCSLRFDCVSEALSIVAMLQVEEIFARPSTGKSAIAMRVKKRNFETEEGDLITLLNIYTGFMLSEQSHRFCSMNFLNFNSLKKVVEIRQYLKGVLKRKLAPDNETDAKKVENESATKSTLENVQKCIAAALFQNAAYLHSSGVYKTVRGNVDLHIASTSALYTVKQPQWVVFYKILHTSKTFMHFVSVIESKWLLELAPHFYRIVIDL